MAPLIDDADTPESPASLPLRKGDVVGRPPKMDDEESDESDTEVAPLADGPPTKGLKVLFLSSDTGGGHRASAESLAKQFELLYPGSTYEVLDVVSADGVPPYSSLVSWYSHLSSHPAQWKLVYSVSNSRAFEMMADVHLKLSCERATRRRILSHNPDLVVSVHPLMCNVPALACQKISKKTGLHLPMFTVVTDLGSAHCLWFANNVDKMYVASDRVVALAKERGKVPDEKLEKIGLPIRHDFAVQAERLGDRVSGEGRAYQRTVREDLGLPHTDRKTVLVMGGGEGVGSLSSIVNHLYIEFVTRGIDAQILVVCGRNEKLRSELAQRNWDDMIARHRMMKESGARVIGNLAFDNYFREHCIPSGAGLGQTGCIDGMYQLRRILSVGALENAVALPLPESSGNSLADSDCVESPIPVEFDELEEEEALKREALDERNVADAVEEENDTLKPSVDNSATDKSALNVGEAEVPGKVTVEGLGFVTRMAEYMVAADILVSKAGPGTIAEAASLSLPVMLTSFLPGQEEGNVDFVVDGKFGAFCSDKDPSGIAEEVAAWLLDEEKLEELSRAAGARGAPHAAADIVRSIGEEALRWKEINKKLAEEKAAAAAAAASSRRGQSTLKRVGSYLQAVPRLLPSYSSVSSSGAGANDAQTRKDTH